MDYFQRFREIGADPGAYAENWKKKTGGKVVGNLCSYTPIELIAAAGALPYRILSSGEQISRADGYLQSYCCGLARGVLEDALAGRLAFLDGAVFPHTCDTIQRLSDIWRMNVGGFHADIILPVKLDTESAAEYMLAVLRKFRADLEAGLGVTISDAALGDAIQVCNRGRRGLERLYALRRRNPEAICGSDLHAVFRAALVMDRGELAEALEQLADHLEAQTPSIAAKTKRLVLSGGLCSMPDIYPVVEASGARVVWDDFCTGGRYFEGLVDESGDPLAAIAQRYRQRVVCPAKHAGIHNRGQYLLDKVKAYQADGVIFLLLKFCDPHGFDYPYMKAMLDKAGIPSLLFEIEDQISSEGQLRTRCEAFLEML
jgi:bzd-type benzoyl-CoA reductase N subunit